MLGIADQNRPPADREAVAFLNGILDRFFRALHTRVPNNWDADRFGRDGVDRSKKFVIFEHREYLKFFVQRYSDFYTAWSLLADARSKALYEEIILFRLAGHLHVRLSTHTRDLRKLWAFGEKTRIGDATLQGNMGNRSLGRYAFTFEGEQIIVEGWERALTDVFLGRHYFFERDGVRIAPSPGDIIFDLGACLGDTSLAFAAAVGTLGKVVSFEFMPDHLRVIRHNLSLNSHLARRVVVVPAAAGLADNGVPPWPATEGAISLQPGASVAFYEKTRSVPIRSVDAVVAEGIVPRVDFIKLDVEGDELAALKGALRSIQTFRPRLAVSGYHCSHDLVVLPRWLNALGYEVFLDHHSIHVEETVFYARPHQDV